MPKVARKPFPREALKKRTTAPETEVSAKKPDLAKLRSIAAQVSKALGDKRIVSVPDDADTRTVDCISTGYQEIDDMVTGAIDAADGSLCVPGTGRGFPRGRIIEIYGPEAAAKTTLALALVAAVQRDGGVAAFLDVEHALSEENARRIGVQTDAWLYSEPDSAEMALKAMQQLVPLCDIVILDSVAALLPENEAEADAGKQLPGLQARLMSQACRKLVGLAAKHNTLVIFINQLRMKIGVMFGNPETTSGGNALKFYASVRVDVRRIEALKKEGRHTGVRVRAKVVKNKVAPPFREAVFDVIFGKGIRIPKLKAKSAVVEVKRKKGKIEPDGSED